MVQIIQFFKEEWGVISGAPFTFALGCLLVSLLAFAIASWAYGVRLKNAKSESESARERVKLLEEQLKQAGMEPKHPPVTQLNVV